MDVRSSPKLTPEDQLTLRKWKWGVAIVYGTMFLFLVFIIAAGPYTKSDTAGSGSEGGFSTATMGPAQVSTERRSSLPDPSVRVQTHMRDH